MLGNNINETSLKFLKMKKKFKKSQEFLNRSQRDESGSFGVYQSELDSEQYRIDTEVISKGLFICVIGY